MLNIPLHIDQSSFCTDHAPYSQAAPCRFGQLVRIATLANSRFPLNKYPRQALTRAVLSPKTVVEQLRGLALEQTL